MIQPGARPAGFTLIEVVLAISLVVVLLLATQLFYAATLRSRECGQELCHDVLLARAALEAIGRDIRSAGGFVNGYGPGLVGDAHSITLHTMGLPERTLFERRSIRDEPIAAQCDLRRVRYYLAVDEEETIELEDGTTVPLVYGLVRWEQKTLNQPIIFQTDKNQFDVQLWSRRIKYLGFRYFDGAEWLMRWPGGPGNSLPQAVKITVGFSPATLEELEHEQELAESQRLGEPAEQEEQYVPDRFSTVVRVGQADVFLGSRLVRVRQVLGSLRGR